jgi:imidazolonepropionase-like amidohydrolase
MLRPVSARSASSRRRRRGRSRKLGVLLAVSGVLALVVLVVWSALVPPAPLALPEAGAVLGDVLVVNPGIDRLAARTVVIEDGRIAEIRAPSDGDPGRYAGHVVLPGLIDMHVHFPPPTGLGQTELFAFEFLAHGVTSVRDAGDVDGRATAPARDGVRAGRFPGPRVFACGPFVDGPQPLWPNSIVVETAADAADAVDRIADAGFDCVKIYDHLTPEALSGVRSQAAIRGLPLIGHVPNQTTYFEADLDDVQHLTGIGRDDGITQRFPRSLAAWQQLDDAAMAETARRIAAAGIANTPTLVALDRVLATQQIDAAGAEPDVRLLPRLYRDAVWSRAGSRLLGALGPDQYAEFAAAFERHLAMVRALHEAGARIHAGSDTPNPFLVPGASLHRELHLLVAAGLSPEAAWAAATTAPGEFLGRGDMPGLGRIAIGAPADLLVFREDPTEDLAHLATLEAVIAAGRLYPHEALEAQRQRHREYADGIVFDRVSVAVTHRILARLSVDPERH